MTFLFTVPKPVFAEIWCKYKRISEVGPSLNILLLVFSNLMFHFACEDFFALSTVTDLRSPLKVKFAEEGKWVVVSFCIAIFINLIPVMRFVSGLILQNDVADFAEERIVQLVVVVHVLPEKFVTSKALTTVITLSFLC